MVGKLLGLALAGLTFFATPTYADWPIEKMNRQIEDTNVIVGWNCSGTFVDRATRLVLTAHHCITQQVTSEVIEEVDPVTGEIRRKTIQKRLPLTIAIRKINDYEIITVNEYRVKIVGIDAKNDIALLQVEDTGFMPLAAAPLAPDSYKYMRGLTIYAVGNPAVEFDNSLTVGIISAPMRSLDFGTGAKLKLFQFSAGVIGGNSGGSILNADGELIGTVTGGLRGSSVNFGIPISASKDLMRRSGFASVVDGAPVVPSVISSGYMYGVSGVR